MWAVRRASPHTYPMYSFTESRLPELALTMALIIFEHDASNAFAALEQSSVPSQRAKNAAWATHSFSTFASVAAATSGCILLEAERNPCTCWAILRSSAPRVSIITAPTPEKKEEDEGCHRLLHSLQLVVKLIT